MESPELRGIYIHPPQNPACADPEGAGIDQLSSSGISSESDSITSNNNNNNYGVLPRKRNVSPDVTDSSQQFDEYEMEKIRRLMAHVDGDRRTSGSIVNSHRGSIDPSLMSSVFVCVLILIFSISVYAFASLYKAVRKRMTSS